MKAAIYGRSANPDENSLENQVSACLKKASELGYEVPESLVFKAISSGLSLKRPLLEVLRKKVENSECNAVIIVKFDRVSRSVSDILTLSKELKLSGVNLICVQNPA
jgi:DNA invertase Pin-like site-specific DNA recombinase